MLIKSKLAATSESILVAKQVRAGLGRHISTLTIAQVENYQKVGICLEAQKLKRNPTTDPILLSRQDMLHN